MLKIIFFYIILTLIKTGEFMILLPQKVHDFLQPLRLPFFSVKKRSSKKKKIIKKQRTYKRKKSKYSLVKRVNISFSLLYSLIRNTAFLTVKKLHLAWNKVKKKAKREKKQLISFRSGNKAVFSKEIKKRKRHRKIKNIAITPFLSKIKYFTLGVVFSSIFVFTPLLFFIFTTELPSLQNLTLTAIPKTTKIYDRNGTLLYEIYANQNRTVVKLSEIPQNLKNATIAIEDKDFYDHPGFDIKGIIRAALNNYKRGELQGGSTITQQLIKSAFFGPEPSLTRKAKEVILAFLTERSYTKDKILELYFNYVPYGGTAWGVESASEIYFGKKVKDLDLAESAFLAGIPRAPSLYSPFTNSDHLWKKRQKEVLDAMVRLGYIPKNEANKAYQKELSFRSPQVPIKAPHFVMYVKDLLVRKYGLSEVERGGLKIKTSLDLSKQELAERIVYEEVENDAYLNIKNGATLISNPKNGDILAMVGNHNYFDADNGGNVNITTSLRQPGSTIKIVTYALALSRGFTEATILDDSPLTISSPWGSYSPVNYDGKYYGKLPLRLAFANSLNTPAVRTAQKFGVENIVNFGRDLGITSWNNPKKYGLSITLGSADLTMIELTTVYGTLANEGKRVNLDPILEITDYDGNIIYKKQTIEKQAVDPGVAFIISDILSDNNARSMAFGTSSPLYIPGYKISVKTGTTDEKRDNWTVGFTKNYVVATWVGNNDNSPMSQALTSGITGAAPIWNKIMTSLLGTPSFEDNKQMASPSASSNQRLSIPSNVIRKFCQGRNVYFIKGTENNVNCNAPTPSPTPTP